MKKLFVLLSICLFCVGCTRKEEPPISKQPSYLLSAQDYYNYKMRHSVIKDSVGHTLILHEFGVRGARNYSFSIEHSSECEKCCEIYD